MLTNHNPGTKYSCAYCLMRFHDYNNFKRHVCKAEEIVKAIWARQLRIAKEERLRGQNV